MPGMTPRDMRIYIHSAAIWQHFYLATPVFLLLDLILGLSIRVPFLDHVPPLKYTYYTAAFCLGLIMWRWPGTARTLAFVDCALCTVLCYRALVITLFRIYNDTTAVPDPFLHLGGDVMANWAIVSVMMGVWFGGRKSPSNGARC